MYPSLTLGIEIAADRGAQAEAIRPWPPQI
jgi:hypothetical protein